MCEGRGILEKIFSSYLDLFYGFDIEFLKE